MIAGDDDSPIVAQVDESSRILGESKTGRYVLKYAKEQHSATVVMERNYVDKDFLIDYACYYCRSFKSPEKHVTRLHFFEQEFDQDMFHRAVHDRDKMKEICGKYIGFSVVKPIYNLRGQPIIGRTILSTYPETDEAGTISRHYVKESFPSNVFGHEMQVESLPFQSQDGEVSKCATVALWTISHSLNRLFGTPTFSLAEITNKASIFPSEIRSTPSGGLILEHMLDYIRMLGLDKDVISISEGDNGTATTPLRAKSARLAIEAYVDANMPLIATFALPKINIEGEFDHHAVVITGYGKDNNGVLKEVYIHDDQIGPYCQTKWPDADSNSLENEWTEEFERDGLFLERLIVPVYPKLRLPFSTIFTRYDEFEKGAISEGMDSRLFYIQVNKYKESLIGLNVKDKHTVLFTRLPRFLAVVRLSNSGRLIKDYIFDATTAQARKHLTTIFFE